MRVGRAVIYGIGAADEFRIDARHQLAQLILPDDGFIVMATGVQTRDTGLFAGDLRIGFGNAQLAMGVKATIIADQIGDLVPHLHRDDRQWHLKRVAAQRADPGGRCARGMAADEFAFQHGYLGAVAGQMQRR